MDQSLDNPPQQDQDWETDNEQTTYYRLVLENASKLKNEFNKIKNYHTKKIKRLKKDETASVESLENLIEQDIVPFLHVLPDAPSGTPYLSLKENEFVIKEKPEIGNNLILELSPDNKDLKVIGVSERFYEATVFRPKKRVRKPPMKKPVKEVIRESKTKSESGAIKKAKTLSEVEREKKAEEVPSSNASSLVGKSLSQSVALNSNKKVIGKKRKRTKRKYIKQSTIIEIKKV